MDAFKIVGQQLLSGTIKIPWCKKCSFADSATALLTDQPCSYRNVPLLSDVRTQVNILAELGAASDWKGILTTELMSAEAITAPYELVRQMRASVLVLGPLLLARRGSQR